MNNDAIGNEEMLYSCVLGLGKKYNPNQSKDLKKPMEKRCTY
jgi:hypothetical protein